MGHSYKGSGGTTTLAFATVGAIIANLGGGVVSIDARGYYPPKWWVFDVDQSTTVPEQIIDGTDATFTADNIADQYQIFQYDQYGNPLGPGSNILNVT